MTDAKLPKLKMLSHVARPAMESTSGLDKRVGFVLVATLFVMLTGVLGTWPAIYGFATSPQCSASPNLGEAPVHLSDDVMISLRTGYMLSATGRPSFNRSDYAQPSTSYIAPYLYWILLRVFPENVAVASYAFLGLLAAGLTAAVLYGFSASQPNGIALATALLLTQTNSIYSLTGWDHLFQGLLLGYSACVALSGSGRFGIMTASIAAALGFLCRPDGALIAVSILFSLSRNRRCSALWGLVPPILIVTLALAVNVLQFGYLFPTPVRLKVGAASLAYSLDYMVLNSVKAYTAMTLFLILSVLFFAFRSVFLRKNTAPIILGCMATAVFALYNSDAFNGARMFWTPACVMAAIATVVWPGRGPETSQSRKHVSFELPGAVHVRSTASTSNHAFVWNVSALAAGIVVLGTLALFLVHRGERSVITSSSLSASATTQQFVIARWIAGNLAPADGAIGFFYLGVSYHLPNFEIADFLGKADERIAGSPVQWGPPGHNKWNIDATLDKWRPQAIVPAGPGEDPNVPAIREAALNGLAIRQKFGFGPALVANDRVRREYSYCYVPDSCPGSDRWGMLVRRDIASRFRHLLRCG